MSLQEIFTENLKRIRREARMNQSELAEKAKIAQPYVSKLETKEEALPSLIVVLQIAQALGCTVNDLVYKKDEKNN